MRAMVLAMLWVMAAPAATAIELRGDACEVRSDYRLSIDGERVRLHRDDGSPREVVFVSGVLRVDGEVLALSPADAARVRDYERRVRDLLLEAKAIAHDAIDIAIGAVAAVARAFGSDAARGDAVAFDAIAARLHAQVEAGFMNGSFDDPGIDAAVEAAIAELIPRLVAGVTAEAVRVALSGDEAAAARLEARTQSLEADIAQAAEARAQALEQRAEALCQGVAALDAIERDWGVHHAGATLDLVEVESTR